MNDRQKLEIFARKLDVMLAQIKALEALLMARDVQAWRDTQLQLRAEYEKMLEARTGTKAQPWQGTTTAKIVRRTDGK